jgi:hypothetical protein
MFVLLNLKIDCDYIDLLLFQSLKNSLHFIVDTASGDHPFDPYGSLLKVFFLRITQYNADAHSTHHTHPYEHMYVNPTPMNTSEGLSR